MHPGFMHRLMRRYLPASYLAQKRMRGGAGIGTMLLTNGLCRQYTLHAHAGAAAFYAMRKYEEHCASEGKPQSHALAKELIAGIVAAEVGWRSGNC